MSYTAMPWNTMVQNSVLSSKATPNVDLGRTYDYLDIYIPIINTGNLILEVSTNSSNTAFFQLGTANVVDSTAGNYHTTWAINAHQYLRILQGHVQNANTTWEYRGYSI